MADWSYPLLAYVLLVIVFIMYVMMQFYRTQRFVSAGISLILFILIFTFFGIRWFQNGLSNTGSYTGNWPPVVNTCPDYLTLYKDASGNSNCVDNIGIANNAITTTFKSITTGTVTPSQNNIFPVIYTNGLSKTQIAVLKKAADDNGLTWEGITDGAYESWT